MAKDDDKNSKQEKLGDAEYELVPFKEIDALKRELSKLKEFPVPSAKKLQISMEDLAMKLDRLNSIMEEAAHMVKVEEGGLSFDEKMRPLVNKMNKVLDQNAEIAKGILAVADLVNDVKETVAHSKVGIAEPMNSMSNDNLGGMGMPPPPPMNNEMPLPPPGTDNMPPPPHEVPVPPGIEAVPAELGVAPLPPGAPAIPESSVPPLESGISPPPPPPPRN